MVLKLSDKHENLWLDRRSTGRGTILQVILLGGDNPAGNTTRRGTILQVILLGGDDPAGNSTRRGTTLQVILLGRGSFLHV